MANGSEVGRSVGAAVHAPGPWQIASVPDGSAYSVMGPESDFMFLRHRADAALIAAAPDLLAALQSLMPYFQSGHPEARVAREAIARATGAPQ